MADVGEDSLAKLPSHGEERMDDVPGSGQQSFPHSFKDKVVQGMEMDMDKDPLDDVSFVIFTEDISIDKSDVIPEYSDCEANDSEDDDVLFARETSDPYLQD
ncbi:hypothetical protein JCGZ_06894 [Jatropha curcas]|uniref:Uncharacterized protein n=1 Tax=Jatropha curcas TaxID=180498 RepID=A0A067KYS0_JATCU|nr:hypothetical protein JCGZ_06894 [Jatropha curcas]